MRSRKEIEEERNSVIDPKMIDDGKYTVELLLDIRELLIKQDKREEK
jgi:hypothetical protein